MICFSMFCGRLLVALLLLVGLKCFLCDCVCRCCVCCSACVVFSVVCMSLIVFE